MSAPARTSIIGRPTICFSLAVNYALNGLSVCGYRAANLGIHLISGLLLFGLIRRTLTISERLREWARTHASVLAFAAALLWTLHPLNSQVVNYIIQRCESMMAMFYLLTLYAAVRSMEGRPDRRLWQVVAIVACALGMGSKEVMVSAPLMVLLYDKTFVSGSFSNALKRGKFIYAGLALTWGVLILMVAMGGQINSARLDRPSWTKYEYALTQSEVIVYYLRLAFWPDPLCFDYAWPAANSIVQVLPFLTVMFALIGATIWALKYRPELGFLGVWFFALLAPSSSIMPLPDMAVEYRIYTALMAVSILVIVGVFSIIRKLSAENPGRAWLKTVSAGVFVLIAVAFGLSTYVRNVAYHSAIALWRDTAAKAPFNPRAHANLGVALAAEKQFAEAFSEFSVAEKLDPNVESLHMNLGSLLAMLGHPREAIPQFQKAIAQSPTEASGYYNLANCFSDIGRKEQAAAAYLTAIKLNPDFRDAHFNYAIDLDAQGKTDEAILHCNEALRVDAGYAPPHYLLGTIYGKLKQRDEAVKHFAAALAINPADERSRLELSKLK